MKSQSLAPLPAEEASLPAEEAPPPAEEAPPPAEEAPSPAPQTEQLQTSHQPIKELLKNWPLAKNPAVNFGNAPYKAVVLLNADAKSMVIGGEIVWMVVFYQARNSKDLTVIWSIWAKTEPYAEEAMLQVFNQQKLRKIELVTYAAQPVTYVEDGDLSNMEKWLTAPAAAAGFEPLPQVWIDGLSVDENRSLTFLADSHQ